MFKKGTCFSLLDAAWGVPRLLQAKDLFCRFRKRVGAFISMCDITVPTVITVKSIIEHPTMRNMFPF
jgi:hypothetical protein